MTEKKWTAPDVVWVDWTLNPAFVHRSKEIFNDECDTEYLLATPERKAAHELYEAWETHQKEFCLRNCTIDKAGINHWPECNYMRELLAKARGEK